MSSIPTTSVSSVGRHRWLSVSTRSRPARLYLCPIFEKMSSKACLTFPNIRGSLVFSRIVFLKSFIDEKTEAGNDVILNKDVQGFSQIKELNEDSLSIFIIPPSFDELKNRLVLRGSESDDAIERRLVNAKKELESAELFDYIVLNDNFNEIYSALGNSSNVLTDIIDANGLLDVSSGANKIVFYYAALADLPSASTYHGAVAHVHATGGLYFAHGGNWIRLNDEVCGPTTS